jgi:hydrocephalus-inducing protein
MMNPTNGSYAFQWTIEEKNQDIDTGASFFKCITQKGVILSGKKFEIIFEYTPEISGIHEAYYCFEIPEKEIKEYFFLVGEVNDPNVFIDVGKVNFGPLLLKGKNKDVVNIKNLEHIPFYFNFDRDSIAGDPEYANSLQVSPMSGVIRADSQVPIQITFAPRIETEYNYNILCHIKQKARPISLNIKGIGYTLHHSVQLPPSGVPLNDKEVHSINFGKIYVNETRESSILIENSGDFNFDFVIKKSSPLQQNLYL